MHIEEHFFLLCAAALCKIVSFSLSTSVISAPSPINFSRISTESVFAHKCIAVCPSSRFADDPTFFSISNFNYLNIR